MQGVIGIGSCRLQQLLERSPIALAIVFWPICMLASAGLSPVGSMSVLVYFPPCDLVTA